MLFPELLAPKKPVSGAIRIGPVSRQDLKLVMLICLNISKLFAQLRTTADYACILSRQTPE